MSNYLTKVEIYRYNNKIKMDYSTIPVTIVSIDGKELYKSLVSDSTIPVESFKELSTGEKIIIKKHCKNDYFLCVLKKFPTFSESEKGNLLYLYSLFEKKYWYKFKMKKFFHDRINRILHLL